MITIQCTKKLLNELKRDRVKEEIDSVPLYSWHSHLFLFNRKKYVIIMNNLTRYNFILPGLKRADFKNFDNLVVDAIAENLLAEGASEEQVANYMQQCTTVSYRPTSDRSIIGQMNEMISVVEYRMKLDQYDGIDTNMQELNRKLNTFVMLKLPKTYSGETMLEELEKVGKG